ncbi:hypothetical protein Rsub_01964 [Raphidocelis subcapitata]|uniref:Uncharacterized protein n=1 Tax=Raphidocelis subcapitata TaxID=307507 RepID=A0A2V0NRW3_9CHLO|nr:hypothetical protein Rsub_01964 [Raphidocelis subcapitata]|eukprot:GBF89392.1 hypothetical protein Rsub_01964 [Raphidocelis subcapitata]
MHAAAAGRRAAAAVPPAGAARAPLLGRCAPRPTAAAAAAAARRTRGASGAAAQQAPAPEPPPPSPPPPADVAPEVLLSLQAAEEERRASHAAAGPSAAAAAIVPRTRARLVRAAAAAGAPPRLGYRSELQAAAGAPCRALAALLARFGLADAASAGLWLRELDAQVELAAATGGRCAAAPDPAAALASWLEERANPPACIHWLVPAAAAEAAGGAAALPLPALEALARALAAAGDARLPAAPRRLSLHGDLFEVRALEAGLDAARAAYVDALCAQLHARLSAGDSGGGGNSGSGGDSSSSGGGGGGGSGGSGIVGNGVEGTAQASPAGGPLGVERAAALLSSLSRLRARPGQPLLSALLEPLRGRLGGAPPKALAELACGAAELGALLRASWLAEFRAAALAASGCADGAAAAGLAWGLARYQQAAAATRDELAPLLSALSAAAPRLAPADAARALVAARQLCGQLPDGWAGAVVEASGARLADARDLAELAALAETADGALAPARPSRAWRAALADAALAVAARRAPAPPARRERRGREEGAGGAGEAGEGPAAEPKGGGPDASDDGGGGGDGGGEPHRAALLRGDEVVSLLAAMRAVKWLRPTGSWLAELLEAYARCPPHPEALPALLPLLAELAPDARAWGARNRRLVAALAGGRVAEAATRAATGRQLARLASAAAALGYTGPQGELLQWIGSALLRLGRGCPLVDLVTVREAFLELDHLPAEERLRQLLNQAAGRLATIRRKAAEAAARKRRVYLKQRANRYNKLHRAKLRAAKKLHFGMGWRATARQAAAAARGEEPQPEWWQRKLRPPGQMDRRF